MKRPFSLLVFGLAACAWLAHAEPSHAAWLWDQNQDKIDDRVVAVETGGLAAAHVGGTLAGKLRFAVLNTQAPFSYGVYVGYDRRPTDADAAALAAVGVPVQVRYRYIDYIRTVASYAQMQQIAQLPGVTRVETIPIFYPVNDIASRTLRGRSSGQTLFPNVWEHLGVTGKGIVVAILDSGVNEEPDGAYPGHESYRGKFLGGGSFYFGQPELNTPLDETENVGQPADPEGTYHGSHVAGTAIGTGGPEGIRAPGVEPGFNAGLAPDARLVDCKVLSDAGAGFGSADALEWLIYNRYNDWGLTGADTIYTGVDVANLSVGGTDESDGSDANCLAVNAAHKADILVCVASGNDGNTGFLVSPGAADLAVTVGAFTDENTIARGDDYVADFSNEGPRNSDGDPDVLDEMKPNVLGSGTGVMSVLGDPTTNGDEYHHINGTSMASPSVAGVAALVRSANPTLSSDQVRQLLMDTADHRVDGGKQPPGAVDPFDADPNYHPSWGWGQTDAYAAVKEALNASSTQVVRISATPQRGPDGIHVSWVSQREVGLARYELDRAPDANGVPGAWTEITEVPVVVPSANIHRVPNRHPYSYTDLDGALDPDAYYWYRVRWVDTNGISHGEPPLRARIMDSPVLARVQFSWTHDFSNGDLYVRYGSGTNTGAPAWFRQAPGSPAADSIVTRPGVNYTGTLQHYFHVDLTADDLVGQFLPPSNANPWFLSVLEGGYINTLGRVESFSVTVFDGPNSTTYTALNPPTATVERTETVFWIPANPAAQANHAPVLQPVGPRSVSEGLTLAFQLVASDPDGQPLTYSATGLPAGASFDPGTRTFTWTPNHAQAGDYSVTFTVTDNFLVPASDAEEVSITVRERTPGENLPPSLDPLSDRAGVRNQRMQFRVTGTDPEGATLTFSAIGLPSGATLDPGSGMFDWVPNANQVGIHEVTFTASDGTHQDGETIYLVISEPGEAPPPPNPCTTSSDVVSGIVGAGIDPISRSDSYHSFVVPSNTTLVRGRLSWFGGPTRDIDFYLLDADSNQVQAAASLGNPEEMTVSNLEPGTYIWRVTAFTSPDTTHYDITSEFCIESTVAAEPVAMPRLSLASAAPNPFQSRTAIHFTLPSAGPVRLKVYNVAGRLVRTLQNGWLPAGGHVRVWNGTLEDGTKGTSGVYFYQLEAAGQKLSRKMTVIE